MANLTENPIWESGIYQIEKTDPVEGGPEGVSNVQAKQLANRSGFLLGELQTTNLRIDEANERIDETNERIDEVLENADVPVIQAALEGAISDIGVLSKEVSRISTVYDQHGQITMFNRGLISGCLLGTVANRLVTMSAGRCFMFGREWNVPANSVEIPDNPNTFAMDLQLCLVFGETTRPQLMVGSFSDFDGVLIAQLSIPAENTMATDPYLSSVSFYPLGRVEPNWPAVQVAPAYYQVWLSTVMPGAYSLSFDVIAWIGGERPTVQAPFDNRADNTFRLYCSGSSDCVTVRFTARLMS